MPRDWVREMYLNPPDPKLYLDGNWIIAWDEATEFTELDWQRVKFAAMKPCGFFNCIAGMHHPSCPNFVFGPHKEISFEPNVIVCTDCEMNPCVCEEGDF